ncbi:type I polyketide synthase [Actinocrispum wychmicini]|uniref:Phenolphthiocerol/phthiocerol polyketide synthase subunit E n=1 Tax=Actinocrispum wychmicini TaxID=1213861 RepID=A0A4R2IR83_9PSEU|nr:type I polyketide synthase [Actinocrispum wychmicini]TCO45315.1 acyl transferase domain-containing protein [Actinocrispum wychmicini]
MSRDPSADRTTGVEPIAIIGMAARIPGANDIGRFWRNLVDGVESITFYTKEEQLALGVTAEQYAHPSFVSAASVIDKPDHFDAEFFGMSSREAEVADPQHRLFLETSHTALEDAGYDSARFQGEIGVYAGTGVQNYQWTNLTRNPKVWRAISASLTMSSTNYSDYVATLTSYKLNLRGPSVTVHTACSTSAVAVHLAVESLRHGECDMALGGGVNVELPLGAGYYGLEGFTSPDGHCRPFDARANGTVWGSGVGVVVLKRLSDAVADGDHIRAVILGNAINNDGADKVGFSAPSVPGQIECIAQALGVADVDPRTVSYVEAHGTGTALGDPIEVEALSTAYTQRTDDRQWCGIGSVKSNIGHLSQASGVIGLIKTTLSLEHRLITATINFDDVNPRIDLADSPFYIANTLSKWEANGTPRRAGVSSFGIGGTNAHMILQEAPAPDIRPTSARPAHQLQVSAATREALSEVAERIAGHFDRHPDIDLADVAYTLTNGRAAHPHRAFVVAADAEAAAEALRDRKLRTGHVDGAVPRVAFLFTGQGGQYAGMGRELYESEPVFAAAVDECAEILELGLDIRDLMFQANTDIGQTRYTQPALFVLEYALATLWREHGVEPEAMIGHSIGEYVAATVAGVFALPDALRLVTDRGRLMQSMPPGAMLAVQRDASDVEGRLAGTGCTVATVNAPGTCVVAGPTEAVDAVAEDFAAHGISCRKLHTSHAFHTSMMDPVVDEFTAAVAAVPRNAPKMRFLSNVTGDWITDEQATDPGYWGTHLRQPVRFGDCVTTLLATEGEWAAVECGPGRQLAGLVRKQLTREAFGPVPSLPGPNDRTGDVATVSAAAGQLFLAGVPVTAFGPAGRRVPLPTYPYQRKRYWVDPDPQAETATPAPHTGPLPFEDWFAVPTWRQLPPAPATFGFDGGCLMFVAGERGAALAAALRADGVDVTEVRPDRLRTRDDYVTLVSGGIPARVVHAWALDAEPAGHGIDAVRQAQDTGFFSLLLLVQALAERDRLTEVHVDILSAGTADVVGGDLTQPEQATLDGIARVVPLEASEVTMRRLDVDGSTTAARLVAELKSGLEPDSGLRTVALRSGRRWALDFQQVPPPADVVEPRTNGRYLITGGLGGIGVTLAEDLATRYQARLVLVSRSGLPPRSTWDAHVAVHGAESTTGRAIEAIRRMERAGSSVLVTVADVTDPAVLRTVREQVVAELGGLDGIVHAAGVPGGGVAQFKARDVVESVFAAKISGTLALRATFADLPLDFVVLCSSVSALGGGFGQVDYCAANSFLDAYARGDHGWPCPVTSVNWGMWLEVGMAQDGLAGAAAREAARVATPAHHPMIQSHTDTEAWGVIAAGTHWVLDHHRIAGVPTLPGTGYLELAHAAVTECLPAPDEDAVVELTDVAFVEPLSVPDSAAAEVRVRFDASGSFVGTSLRDGVRREHVRGTGRWVRPEPAQRLDLAAVKARSRRTEIAFGDESSQVVSVGGHWDGLREIYEGDNEELALIEAPQEAIDDLVRWTLQPALLDQATSFGTRDGISTLPLGYGRLVIRGPLPARFYSYRRFTAEGPQVLTADLLLVDEDGVELVGITDFTRRRVDVAAVAAAVSGEGKRADPLDVPDDRRGIRPMDGARAFRRILAGDLGPQVVVNAESVTEMLVNIRRPPVELAGESLVDTDTTTGAVETMTDLEAKLVAMWMESLGIDRVGVDDDFFELGGNSLVAVQLIAAASKLAGVRLPMRILFETPTISGFAARIEELRAAAQPEPPRPTIPRLARREGSQ